MGHSVLRSKLSFNILCLLLLYMPMHYYLCELLLSGTRVDNILRDIILLLLVSMTTISFGHFKCKRIGLLVIFNCVVLLLFAVFSVWKNDYPGTFNILRTYLMPCLIFFVCSQINLDKKQFIKIHKIIIIELAIVALYGFFQAFFLGDDFLLGLGYKSRSGGNYLAGSSFYIGGYFGYQRSVGTFISPNVCAVILAIALCVLLFGNYGLKTKTRNILLAMLGVGLLATFSRSAILGFIISWLFTGVVLGRGKKLNVKKTLELIGFIIVAIAVLLMIDRFFLGNLFTSMLTSSFMGAFSSTLDASTVKHISDMIEPIKIVVNNPFGLGFGNNGPMALELSSTANTVESSIYLMMYETGILFGPIFFIPYISVIISTIRNRRYRYYIPAAVCITVFSTYIALPNVQIYEVLFYSFIFIGLYYNKSVREMMLNAD